MRNILSNEPGRRGQEVFYGINDAPPASSGGGGTAALTFNNSGAGAASGTTFDGSVARTISYNSIGAQAAGAYLTVNQAITLSGDISGSGTTAITTTIGAGKVTLAMQANMATGSLVYRKTAGAGAPEVQTLATLKTDLGLTGTNSGDQTITLSGDVSGTGTGAITTVIGAGKVTLAMQANMATASLFYRKTAGSGAPEVQTLATLKTDLGLTGTNSGDQFTNMTSSRFLGRITAGFGASEELTGTQATTLLDAFTSALKGLAPASGGGTTNFLRADGTWAIPPGSGIADGDKGDITVSGTGTVWTIDNSAIGLAKIASIADQTILGNNSGVSAAPIALTATQATAMLNPATTSLKGAMSAEDKTRLDASFTRYHSLLDCSGSHIAARVAGTYGMGQGDPLAITGTGTLYPLNIIRIDATDYPAAGTLAAKLRVKIVLECNDVAPGHNFVFGLHPVTRPATSGGAGLVIYSIGAVVASSTVTITTPAADSQNTAASADFALPADGYYVIGCVTNGTTAASAHVHIAALLQMHYA